MSEVKIFCKPSPFMVCKLKYNKYFITLMCNFNDYNNYIAITIYTAIISKTLCHIIHSISIDETDYQETFSLMISTNALRSQFAITTMENKIIIFDIKTFFYGDLNKEVYMYPPEGYDCKNKIFKLKRALDGLKQTLLCWNMRFASFL